MDAADLDALVSVTRILVALSARAAAVQGALDLNQFRALVIVASLRSASLGELASAARMHLSTTSRLCDRLVGMGLLRRIEQPTNRSQVALSLTSRGDHVVVQVDQQRRDLLLRLLEQLPESKRKALVSLLQEIVRAGGEPAQTELWAMAWTT